MISAVESFTVPVRLNTVYLGVAAQFENRRAGAGERVAYDVVALNADGRAQVEAARRFLEQADEALKARNVVFAGKLADKAAIMAAVLVR